MLLEPNLLIFILAVIGGYFIGSIPFGFLITRLKGYRDIRKVGSGNIGATNVLRNSGPKLAIITLLLDGAKGYIAVIIATNIIDIYSIQEASEIGGLIAGAGSVLGHNFPIWLKFKGGKGVATYIGFLIGLNFLIGLYFLLTWIIVALIFKYSSLGSLAASLVAPLYFFFVNPNNFVGIFLLYLFFIISLKHHENIKRLINGSENKIKLSK